MVKIIIIITVVIRLNSKIITTHRIFVEINVLHYYYYYYYYYCCYYYYYYYYYYYFYSYTRKRLYRVTFKPEDIHLEDIHRSKFCATTFFICHYTDFGNGK